ncbi:Serine/threonine-protein kinase 36 [Neolecta irregularis DAH-3]|uniref:Serine/threonine-protein kinase 36 n=1 Tax=Neolecta irregularis (strain DAH-3) TaxID=1198029 RepID=A0A1U7LM38_NEOID|nr:Serine/threonine-protein kinase 36 [Neolecta irregularis DAH-3]|eukprot:OLL23709.1 Serine/threonine-protein kinase 36 [Neolecta irregularis DAH-3]
MPHLFFKKTRDIKSSICSHDSGVALSINSIVKTKKALESRFANVLQKFRSVISRLKPERKNSLVHQSCPLEAPRTPKDSGFEDYISLAEQLIMPHERLIDQWQNEKGLRVNVIKLSETLALPSLRHFRFHEIVGCGGTGFVIKVTTISGNKPLALKFVSSSRGILNDIFLNEDYILAFLSCLNHSNLPLYYPSIITPHYNILVSEYMQTDLLKLLEDPGDHGLKGKLNVSVVKSLFKGVVNGIYALHVANIAHSDIKIENVLVKQSIATHLKGMKSNINQCDGCCLTPIICDFGLAQQKKSLLSTYGTPDFAAPEFWQSTKHSKCALEHMKRGDIWALGCLLLELLQFGTEFSFQRNDVRAAYAASGATKQVVFPENWENEENCFRNALNLCLEVDEQKRISIRGLKKVVDRW